MTKVDFFVWPMCKKQEHDLALCHLIKSIYKAGESILIQLDEGDCEHFDSLLWTFEDASFIPHGVNDNSCPVKLSTNIEKYDEEVLVNLGKLCPDDTKRFKRIIETAGYNESTRGCARKKFAAYRNLELEVVSHQLNSTAGVKSVTF